MALESELKPSRVTVIRRPRKEPEPAMATDSGKGGGGWSPSEIVSSVNSMPSAIRRSRARSSRPSTPRLAVPLSLRSSALPLAPETSSFRTSTRRERPRFEPLVGTALFGSSQDPSGLLSQTYRRAGHRDLVDHDLVAQQAGERIAETDPLDARRHISRSRFAGRDHGEQRSGSDSRRRRPQRGSFRHRG